MTGFEVLAARRHFGATKAVDGIDLRVPGGSVTALLGANGSGKSTLVKILAGVVPADAGTIDVGSGRRPLASWDASSALDAGFRFVHQDLGLFPALSVADNFAVGHGFPTSRIGRVRRGDLRERAAAIMTRLNVHLSPDKLVGDLSPGEQSLVAIGRALQDSVGTDALHRGRLLVLDEPTAALGRDEANMLLEVLTGLAASGETVMYIGHRLAEIFTVADRIVVLRDGRVVMDRARADTSRAAVINVMVTAEPGAAAAPINGASSARPDAGTDQQAPLLECRGLALGPLRSVDVSVPSGRIVGIAGLQGSGRTLLLRTLFGDVQPDSGVIRVGGARVALKSPVHAVAHGLALVPGDRGREGIFPGLTVRENMLVSHWGRYRGRLFMSRSAQQQATRREVRDLAIRTAGDTVPITALSGGNQQKVVLARWLLRGARVLLLDEPTQGVDVVARKDLWRIVRKMTADGGAALVVSSDLEELLEVSDDVLVLRDGMITHHFARGEVDEEGLNRACQGVDHEDT
jgi:ribose transport system ATP-binding protein